MISDCPENKAARRISTLSYPVPHPYPPPIPRLLLPIATPSLHYFCLSWAKETLIDDQHPLDELLIMVGPVTAARSCCNDPACRCGLNQFDLHPHPPFSATDANAYPKTQGTSPNPHLSLHLLLDVEVIDRALLSSTPTSSKRFHSAAQAISLL